MSFNIGLSGIRAADSDLQVTGNNIANASTTGFKRSRAEFGDLYASSIVGSAADAPGNGVALTDISQQFTQGNIAFTENVLDLAINGTGFFVLSDNGDPSYTRAGMFSTDEQGYLVNNSDLKLQGFAADEEGNIVNGVLTDLRVQTGIQAPQQTTDVDSQLNLDALALAPVELVATSNGTAVLTPTTPDAAQTSVTSEFGSATDFSADQVTVSFSIPGTTAPAGLTLNGNIPDLATLVSTLNTYFGGLTTPYSQLQASANGTELDISLTGTEAMNDTNFSVNLTNVSGNGIDAFSNLVPEITSGISSTYQAPDNGYNPGQLNVITATGIESLDLTTEPGANATALQIADYLNDESQNQLLGINADARTNVRLSNIGAFNDDELFLALKSSNEDGDTTFLTLNPAGGAGSIEQQIVDAINEANVPGLSAEISSTGVVDIAALNGEDIVIQNQSATETLDYVSLTDFGGNLSVPASSPGVQTLNSGLQVAVGGELDITVDDGISIEANTTGTPGNIWGALPGNSSNTFDPNNAETYNSATSVTIYDSLGQSHVMTQYFVKERTDPTNINGTSNTWSMYVLIDGENVGNPPAGSNSPGLAQFELKFLSDGTLSTDSEGPYLISNWTPLDESGNYNGALGPDTAGSLPLEVPETSSNFTIDIAGTTQFGSDFSVNDVEQNGYTSGRLTGLNIDSSGVIFARFTNGQAQTLGQIALAGFTNEQGLQPVGETGWVETFQSGDPLVWLPETGDFGAIQSGALEESNVDLSEELVNLIIAQRNYQSNAKTIETADQVTQAILNI